MNITEAFGADEVTWPNGLLPMLGMNACVGQSADNPFSILILFQFTEDFLN